MKAHTVPSCAWWHQPPTSMEPLDAVRVTADHLERGEPVPPMAASIVAKALRLYLAGQRDITGNLGLRPKRGGHHGDPLVVEAMVRRDGAIARLYELQEGPKTKRAEKVAALLRTPPEVGRVTEDAVMAYVLELRREFGSNLPTSSRQVLRVVDGETSSGRKR